MISEMISQCIGYTSETYQILSPVHSLEGLPLIKELVKGLVAKSPLFQVEVYITERNLYREGLEGFGVC